MISCTFVCAMSNSDNIVRQGSVNKCQFINPSRLSTYNITDGVAPCKPLLGTGMDLKCVKTYQTVVILIKRAKETSITKVVSISTD